MIIPNEQTPALCSPYSTWFGRPVVLRVASGESQTALSCVVMGESETAVRVRLGGVWEVDIYKELVLAVEDILPV